MLVIYQALQTWRHFLEGSKHEVIIMSDHKNLTYFQKPQRFNMKLMHMPGSKMIQSDALSRCPDHIPEKDTDDEDIVLLPDELFIKLINMELAKLIKSAATSDEFAKNMDKVLSTKGVPPIKSNLSDWKIEDRVLFYQD